MRDISPWEETIMKRKMFIPLLALVLALSLLPMAALADETEPAEPSMVEEPMEEAAEGSLEEPENEPADTPAMQAEPIVEAEPVMLDAAAGVTELTQGSVDSMGTLALEDGKTYQLMGPVEISAPISVTGTVTLDLNGYTLKATGSGPVIRVGTGDTVGDLTIRDSGSSGQIIGASVSDTSSAGCIRVAGESKLTLQGGTVTGGTAGGTNSAGGVWLGGSADFTMTGGTISGCTTGAQYGAGGVYVGTNAAFTMTGGTVTGCTTGAQYSAGGVYVTGGTFTLQGGTINDCDTGISNTAGGVYVSDGGTFNLRSGGKISSCDTGVSNSAGGVYVASGEMDMSGGEIWYCNMYIRNASEYKSGSYTAAGGVYNKGQLNISGGTVQFCNLVNDTGELMGVMTGAAGGIQNAGTFTMTGSSQLISNTFYIVSGTNTTTIIDSSLSNAGTMNANGGTVYGLINTGAIQTSGAKETVFDLLRELDDIFNSYLIINYGPRYLYNAEGGTISGGTFSGALMNYGSISGGRYDEDVSNSGGTIFSGRFDGKVGNSGSISNGTFNGEVTNANKITGGTFESKVTNGNNSEISGGTFNGNVEISNSKSTISGGVFTGKVINETQVLADTVWYGTVKDGDFSRSTELKSVAAVTFDSAGGSAVGKQWRYNWPADEPTAPTQTGYKFLGWYNGSQKWDFDTNITADITLTAKWESLPKATATAPAANNRTYDGTDQPLVTGGAATNGTMMYGLSKDGAYTTDVPTGKNADTYTVWYYAKGDGVNYNDSDKSSVSVTVAAKNIQTVSMWFASTGLTYNGSVQSPTLTVNDTTGTLTEGADYTVAAAETTATGPTGAASARDAGNYNLVVTGKGNYTGKKTLTWSIRQQPVTLTGAGGSKPYDGTALTNTTVTASGMVTGEKFDYNFTGTQTAIGSSKNRFTAKDSATAKVANYDITYNYGMLTVSLPANIGETVKDMTEDNVTSDDRETIENTLQTVEDYLDMEPSEDEKTELEALKDRLDGLLGKLNEVRNATEDKTVTRVEDITADNAKPSDKNKLEKAKEAIEDILDRFGDNLTESEKKAMEDDIARIEAALKAIEQASQTKRQAVKTGDESMPMLWLALALTALAALPVAARKHK